MLLDGSEIPDDLYVKIFLAKIRLKFAYKDKNTLGEELTFKA